MAGENLDKRKALFTELTQQLDTLHRPTGASSQFGGYTTGECGHLFEQKKLADEELSTANNRLDWSRECQLLSLRQGESFSWNCFLPQRELKILLVETDDSTRQVLTALLRNCNYSVISVANGLQAWDILGNSTNHVDMVLTEVVLPGLSGIGLLRRITSHTLHKDVPVIMMSTSDSMGLVVKCLSNGAADFLLKPVRKNELSNLWQHVWRRNHSVHGNANQNKSLDPRRSKRKCRAGRSEMNLADGTDDGSDDGSRTQSSWTKPVRGEESPRKKRGKVCSYMPHVDSSKKEMSTTFAEEASDINQATSPFVPASAVPSYEKEMHAGVDSRAFIVKARSLVVNEGEDKEDLAGTLDISDREPQKSFDFFGILGCKERGKQEEDSTNSNAEIQTGKTFFDDLMEKTASVSPFLPTLELSLKQQRAAGEIESQEKTVLKRSISSAFSRYNSNTNSLQLHLNKSSPKSNEAAFSHNQSLVIESSRNCTSLETMLPVHAEKNSDVVKPLSLYPFVSHRSENQDFGSLSTVTNQDDYANPRSNNNSNSSAVGSTDQFIHTPTNSYKETTFHCDSLHPLFYTHSVAQTTLPYPLVDRERTSETAGLHDPTQCCDTYPDIYCHSHYHTLLRQHQNLQENSHVTSQPDEPTVANARCDSSQCGLSFTVNVTESNNNSRSNSNGSECNRNGRGNEIVTASNYIHEKINAPSDMQPTRVFVDGIIEYGRTKIDTGDGLMKTNGSLMTSESEQNPSARREAALSKFRQKRKERCFHKKIRYLSRKVLAEQRPRVKGQFVRQPVCVPAINKPELCVGTVF